MKITPDTLLKPRWATLWLGVWLALAIPVWAQLPGPGSDPNASGFPNLLGPAPAPVAEAPQPVVEEISIQIEGKQQISSDSILAHVLLREKMTYNQELLDKSLDSLYATGEFTFIQTNRELLPGGGVRIVLIIFPKNRISAVVFKGNKEYSQTRLTQEIKTVAGGVLDEAQLKHDKDSLFAFYQKKGYSLVKIDTHIDPNESTGTAVVTFDIDEGPDVSINDISFVGNDHVGATEMLNLMDTSKYIYFISFSLKRGPSWITGSGYFEKDKFQDDLDKLRKYYKSKGYLDVDIPDSEVEFKYPQPNKLALVIHVHEGRQYHLGDITVSGNTIFPTEALMSQLTLKKGEVFSPEDVDKNAEKMRSYYGKSGYLETFVRVDRKPDLDTGAIGLDFVVIESDKYYVEGVDIQGNTKTRSTVIVRELTLAPGDVFDSDRMATSESHLKNTGYFQDGVSITPEETNIAGKRNMRVTVEEAKTFSASVIFGFDPVEGGLASLEFSESNFDLFNPESGFRGGGEKARIKLTAGNEENGIEISYEDPWLWQRRLDGGIDLFHTESSYYSSTYNEDDTGFDVYLRKPLFDLYDPFWHLLEKNDPSIIPVQGIVKYTLENVQIKDVTTEAPPQIMQEAGYTSISKVSLNLLREDLNDPLAPTRGTRYELINEVAGGPFAGQTNYYRLEGHLAWWYPTFAAGNQVFALATWAGTVIGYGGKDVPYSEKYFLGGDYNMRGYAFRNVGPRYLVANSLAFGQPIGGNSVAFASPEYSIEVFTNLRAAVFYDIGYVNENAFDFSPGGYQQDVGFGLRFTIPILKAPMRIDIGYPLNPNSFQSHSFQFNFSFSAVY